MINIPKGTKDVLPFDSYKWQYLESQARNVARLFNAREIRTPSFEHTELFTRSIGEGTDVVSKEMYTFLDKGGRSITLKPEGTAPVARSYIENTLESESLPLKMFYITPVFRYENTQAGRFREHHQFGAEFYGSASPFMDAEVITLAYQYLCSIGLNGVSLRLNSLGCVNCRTEFTSALKGFLAAHTEGLCDNCKRRQQNNTLRTLDCKEDKCKKILEKSPSILDFICPDCASHFNKLKELLTAKKIPFTVDSSIVRGLDYYNRTVFEFVSDSLGSQSAVCGGGRYDNMVESVGGNPTPCVGFGMGLERLLMILEASDTFIPSAPTADIFIAGFSDTALNCMQIVDSLRQNGISAETDLSQKSLKAQLRYADKIKAKYSVVLGSGEVESGEANLKNMNDGSVVKVKLCDIVFTLKSLL